MAHSAVSLRFRTTTVSYAPPVHFRTLESHNRPYIRWICPV